MEKEVLAKKISDRINISTITYLIAITAVETTQSQLTSYAEFVLAASFLGSGFISYHFKGISRDGIPTLEDLGNYHCDELTNEKCKTLCKYLKVTTTNLEHSGTLGCNGKTAWKIVKYGAGAGGIALALTADSVLLGGLGAALCLPSVLEWAEEKQSSIEYWKEKAKELKAKYDEFLRTCVRQT